ncbi:tetratricopeptide repeat protein [Bacteroidia bacterium]|nr:tetratricopeptide repeat protein [Bacteroidia bacterium]MDC1395050.1 tetratricopeptide repeat protein [Bacteroidia bacterium]
MSRKVLLLLFIQISVVVYSQTANDYYRMASKKFNEMNFIGASVDYTKAIYLSPDAAALYNNRGLCYAKLEKWEKAELDFAKSIELDPSYKQALFNMGNMFSAKLEYELAVLNYDKALALDSLYKKVFAKKA